MAVRTAIPQTVAPITRALFGPGARLPEKADAYAPLFRRHGIAVMPLPYGGKEPFAHCPTHLFFETPLADDDIPEAFKDDVNLAVIVGRISGNLAILDAETPAQFGIFLNIFHNAQIPICAVQTGKGGHLYFRCADGELANIPPKEGREWELWGNRHYCVSAPSVHPTGAIYTVIEWVETGTQIPVLTLAELCALLPDVSFKLAHRQARPLTPETQEFLAGRTAEGNRNNQLLTTTHELLGRGMALPDVELQVVVAAIATGLSRREARATFWSAVKGHEKDGGKVNRELPRACGKRLRHGRCHRHGRGAPG